MRRRESLQAALGLSAAVFGAQTRAQVQGPAPPAPPVGELKSLGNERYQIGRIIVDKRMRSFTVPGRIQALEKPLEYLATTPKGRRAYESLLALDTIGSELNLACILIGLERDPKVPTSKPLSVAGQAGQPVLLSVAWTDATGQRRVLTAAEALLGAATVAKDAVFEWAYTGSFSSSDGSRLAADVTGTLISFVRKDVTGVIEMATGRDLGPYGAVRGSTVLPPEGTPIELIVDAATAKK